MYGLKHEDMLKKKTKHFTFLDILGAGAFAQVY